MRDDNLGVQPLTKDQERIARLERELEEARRHLRLSEYQVKRKQINADQAEAANRALRTSLEEARQELDRRDDEALGWRDENDKLRADLEEARQERDAARVSARSQKTKAQHARRAQQAMGARIQTLEAALRRIADWETKHLDVPNPGYGAQIALQMRSIARRALQLTTEEVTQDDA